MTENKGFYSCHVIHRKNGSQKKLYTRYPQAEANLWITLQKIQKLSTDQTKSIKSVNRRKASKINAYRVLRGKTHNIITYYV